MTDFFATGAYNFVDIDDDGDLDIVTVPFNGAPVVYENQLPTAPALVIELRDSGANRLAIDARVEFLTDTGDRLVRTVKASCGFLSTYVREAWFGLGTATHARRLVIIWPDGHVSETDGVFYKWRRYRVTRLRP